MTNKAKEKSSTDSDVFRYYALRGIRTVLMVSFATAVFVLASSLPMAPESAKYFATHPGAKVILMFSIMFVSVIFGVLFHEAIVPSKIVEQFNPNRNKDKTGSNPLID